MTSQRKLKKRAEAQGMTGPELQLVEMMQEVLHDMRWMQILAYTNQYLLNQKLNVSQEERDQVLEAATRAVDKDSKQHEWKARLDRLKTEIGNIHRKVDRAQEDLAPEHAPGSAELARTDAEPPSGRADPASRAPAIGREGTADAG